MPKSLCICIPDPVLLGIGYDTVDESFLLMMAHTRLLMINFALFFFANQAERGDSYLCWRDVATPELEI